MAEDMAEDRNDGRDEQAVDGRDRNDDDIEFLDDDLDDLDGDDDLDEYDEYEFLDIDPLDFEEVAEAIGLPDELPALRLPGADELAARARAAVLPLTLAKLADWVGEDGRATDSEGDLRPAEAKAAAAGLGLDDSSLRFAWEFALDAAWIDFADEEDAPGEEDAPDGGDVDPLEDDLDAERVVRGETADDWASGADADALDAWRATFVSVLTSTFDVILDSAPEPIVEMDLDGQGIAMAIMLFLARAEGLAMTDISEVILDTATAEMEPEDSEEARDAWLKAYGDPARLITAMLAQLDAVSPPDSDDGAVRLTPLGLWGVREELTDIGVDVPLLPASVQDMTAAELVLLADDTEADEFESESGAWVVGREPGEAAGELLTVAADGGPDARLIAVSVVTRIGQAATPAWRNALSTPELRPYAKIALAGLAADSADPDSADPDSADPDSADPDRDGPGQAVTAEIEPTPEDLAWVATDMLVLACDDEDPDPEAVAECLGDSVPAGEEATLFGMMANAGHPDTVHVLRHIGRHHPDAGIAKEARAAMHRAQSRLS
ncbi:MAG TPA: hypothetical protein VGG75_20995 [Trebonia sp.]|jgi:hypothetical protein